MGRRIHLGRAVFIRRKLDINHSTSEKPRLAPVKTRQRGRALRLGPACAAALRWHRWRQEQERGAWRYLHGLVFVDLDGGPVDYWRLLKEIWWPALQATGLPRIRLTDLRDTMATRQDMAGVPLKVQMETLGHGLGLMILHHYRHTFTPEAIAAAYGVESLLTSKKRGGAAGNRTLSRGLKAPSSAFELPPHDPTGGSHNGHPGR